MVKLVLISTDNNEHWCTDVELTELLELEPVESGDCEK